MFFREKKNAINSIKSAASYSRSLRNSLKSKVKFFLFHNPKPEKLQGPSSRWKPAV